MRFDSPEEKVIYEKLTHGRVNEILEPEISAMAYEQNSHHTALTNAELLRTRMNEVSGYIGTLIQTRDHDINGSVFSNRKIVGRFFTLAKRLIRKMTYWYIGPMFKQQTIFNNAVTPSIGCMTEINGEMINTMFALSEGQEELRLQQQQMGEKIKEQMSDMMQRSYVELKQLREANEQLHNELRQQREDNEQLGRELRQQRDEANEQLSREIRQNRAEDNERRSAELKTMLQAVKEQYAKIQVIFEYSMRMEREQSARKFTEFENILTQRQQMIEDIQKVGSAQLLDLQARMDKLNKLDLDVFADDYKDIWEKDTWGVGTFAQCGEDMIITFLLRAFGMSLSEASYVDLGANHAKKISNTYHFYKQGARGVLVEANPALIPDLKFYRNGDVILNRCVAEQSGKMVDFYIMGDSYATGDGLSTTDRKSAMEFIKQNKTLKIHNIISVETISFHDIIENYMGATPIILNVDIEGHEIEILKSINFNEVRPFIIILEMIPYVLPFVINERNKEILDCMENAGYVEYAYTGVNSIFLDKNHLTEKGLINI